jgi:hypothetical protein
MQNLLKNKALLIAGGALLVVILLGAGVVGKINSVQKDGIGRETALSAQYDANRIKLSQIKTTFYSSLDVANLKSEKMDQIIEDAVKGRYDGNTSARPGTGSLFSAITEAYPDLSNNLDVYDKIVDFLMTERKEYAQQQTKLRDMIREYDTWRKSGVLHRMWVGFAGVPTDALEAHANGVTLTGEAALQQMKRLAIHSGAQDAYDSGVDDGERVPAGK